MHTKNHSYRGPPRHSIEIVLELNVHIKTQNPHCLEVLCGSKHVKIQKLQTRWLC